MAAKRNSGRDGEMGRKTAFDIDAPVDLASLDRELSEELGLNGRVGLIADGDLTAASPQNPVTVWTVTQEVETNTFKKVFTAHDGEKLVAADAAFEELLRKARDSDDPFTPDEIDLALRSLLRRAR